MIKYLPLVLVLTVLLFPPVQLYGQEDLLDTDTDSLDDLFSSGSGEGAQEEAGSDGEPAPPAQAEEAEAETVLEKTVRKKGLTLTGAYSFKGGYSPGWSQAPWFWEGAAPPVTHLRGVEMTSALTLDFQLSSALRVKQVFKVSFPVADSASAEPFSLTVGDFFADYNWKDLVFFRIGKHTVNWGASRNYPVANLPARLPAGSGGGDSYAFKAEVPLGRGGLQLLALTRPGFFDKWSLLRPDDIGWGVKYNLALPGFDLNWGGYYQAAMRLRTALTLETTLPGGTELYSEGLLSLNQESLSDPVFAVNAGFYDDYFDGKLAVNGEYLFNGESYTYVEPEENDFVEETVVPELYGHNLALNLTVKPVQGSLRLFARSLFNINQLSGHLTPGFTISPWPHIRIYAALPMALGAADGIYYSSNIDEQNRPFSLILAVTISGKLSRGMGGTE